LQDHPGKAVARQTGPEGCGEHLVPRIGDDGKRLSLIDGDPAL